jgi:hypothetical protein
MFFPFGVAIPINKSYADFQASLAAVSRNEADLTVGQTMRSKSKRQYRQEPAQSSTQPGSRTSCLRVNGMACPMTSPQSLFWYNKELCGKAGVDPTKIKYWEDFLDAVKKCKAAGVTPIIVGGADERPLHFYPVLLMMRILGKDGMAAAYKGDNGGFAGPDMVKAWSM